uniref:Phospholipase A(2) n=1 Tax=Caenorhabditis japonica TaxID=281687 RepID=A0A8R1DR03_CAEJA
MLSLLFFVQSSFVFFASAQYSTVPDTLGMFGIPYQQFHCGTGDHITEEAARGVNDSCPTVAPEINHCCAIHDDCYTAQRGLENCDNAFCKCLKRTAVGKLCKDFLAFTCTIVNLYGSDSYNKIDKKFVYKHKTVPSVSSLRDDYKRLYDTCPHQNITLSSCALNYNICAAKKTSNCGIRLVKCLDATELDRDQSEKCDREIGRVTNRILFSKRMDVTMSQIMAYRIEEKLSIVSDLYRQVRLSGKDILFNPTFLGVFFIFVVVVIGIYIRLSSDVEKEKQR